MATVARLTPWPPVPGREGDVRINRSAASQARGWAAL